MKRRDFLKLAFGASVAPAALAAGPCYRGGMVSWPGSPLVGDGLHEFIMPSPDFDSMEVGVTADGGTLVAFPRSWYSNTKAACRQRN